MSSHCSQLVASRSHRVCQQRENPRMPVANQRNRNRKANEQSVVYSFSVAASADSVTLSANLIDRRLRRICRSGAFSAQNATTEKSREYHRDRWLGSREGLRVSQASRPPPYQRYPCERSCGPYRLISANEVPQDILCAILWRPRRTVLVGLTFYVESGCL